MTDGDESQQQPDADEQQRAVLNLRQDRAQTSYANLAMITSTPEEVVLHFGINVSPPTRDRQVNAEITSRVIMSYPSAKRLALTLGNVIQRYEAQKGVIEVGRPAAPSVVPFPGPEAAPDAGPQA